MVVSNILAAVRTTREITGALVITGTTQMPIIIPTEMGVIIIPIPTGRNIITMEKGVLSIRRPRSRSEDNVYTVFKYGGCVH